MCYPLHKLRKNPVFFFFVQTPSSAINNPQKEEEKGEEEELFCIENNVKSTRMINKYTYYPL